MTDKPKSLASKLAEINAGLHSIQKKGRNEYHRYDYFTEGQLMAELRLPLAERQVVIIPSVEQISAPLAVTNQKGNTEQLVTVTTTYLIVDGETGERFEVRGAGMGLDAGDKGVYKAITGAMKYFLMKLFFVSDEADPEKEEQKPERHSPSREEKPSKTPPASAVADLAQLRAWMEEHQIPEGYVMKKAAEHKLASKEKSLDELKPATLTRLLTSRKRLLDRFTYEAKGTTDEPYLKNEKGSAEERTDEGAQPERGQLRQPVQDSISPVEYLEQEGVQRWQDVVFHFGKKSKGTALGDIDTDTLAWWITNYKPEKFRGNWNDKDLLLDAALCVAHADMVRDEAGE